MAEQNQHRPLPTSKQNSSPENNSQQTVPQPKSIFHRTWGYAFRKLPSFFPDPNHKEMLASFRRGDVEKNAQTEPPEDEVIDLRCVWALEFYTPSHIEKLLAGFASLGWDEGSEKGSNEDIVQWVRRLRESSRGGGWLNLGLIQRPGTKGLLGHHRTAPLPADVEYAIGAVYGLTSSITCIAMGFVLTEECSRRFDQALRREYQTYSMRRGRSYRIHDPFHQKGAEIRTIRSAIRAASASWFRTYLPGLFSSGILDGELPTCELVTLRKAQPFPKNVQGAANSDEYLRLLDMDRDVDVWESEQMQGLRFVWPMLRDRENRFHAIMATNEGDIDQEKLRTYGGPGRLPYVIYVDAHVNGLLSRWSLLAVLSGFERHLNVTRDSATLRPDGRQKPAGVLKSLSALISQSGDISAASSDLSHFAKLGDSFAHEVATFKPCNPRLYRDQSTELGEILRQTIVERSSWVHNADRSVRDLMIQYGSIVGAWENIRLQKSLKWLTVVITILTAVMAYFTFKDSRVWKFITDYLVRLMT